jgi:hypothetical protein
VSSAAVSSAEGGSRGLPAEVLRVPTDAAIGRLELFFAPALVEPNAPRNDELACPREDADPDREKPWLEEHSNGASSSTSKSSVPLLATRFFLGRGAVDRRHELVESFKVLPLPPLDAANADVGLRLIFVVGLTA